MHTFLGVGRAIALALALLAAGCSKKTDSGGRSTEGSVPGRQSRSSAGPDPGARASALTRPNGTAWEGLSIYLACGDVGGPGLLVQLDRTGRALGTVRLPAAPYGLAASQDALVAALPSGSQSQVMQISADGGTRTLFRDRTILPAPITVAVTLQTGEVVVGDNQADRLVRLLSSGAAETLRQIEGSSSIYQNMSLALTRDGYTLLGTSEPAGIYRFRPGTNSLGASRLLGMDGAVVADPWSDRWVALLPRELTVFRGGLQERVIGYPEPLRKLFGGGAFAQDGSLVLVLGREPAGFEVLLADLVERRFESLFRWDGGRVLGVAVGPRMPWPENAMTDSARASMRQEAPRREVEPVPSPTADPDLGKSFNDLQELYAHFEFKGFVGMGRFESAEWPARIVAAKQATNEISFRVRSSGTHTYPGYNGYLLKVVFLEDAIGRETVVVLRSRVKLTAF